MYVTGFELARQGDNDFMNYYILRPDGRLTSVAYLQTANSYGRFIGTGSQEYIDDGKHKYQFLPLNAPIRFNESLNIELEIEYNTTSGYKYEIMYGLD
jgi:hypothetical protein